MILAGFDEAGYGPLLGPLVVSGTVFKVAEGSSPEPPDLWKVLDRSTTKKPDGSRIPVNDSKKLYSTAKGVGVLEETALSFLSLEAGGVPSDFRSLIRRLLGNPTGDCYLDLYPWYRGRDLALPLTSYKNRISVLGRRLSEDLSRSGVGLAGIRSVPLEVLEFNQHLEGAENKAAISFHLVASLLEWLWKSFPGEGIEAHVDRQGGRIHYGPLLYQKIRPRGIRIGEETDRVSSYELCREGPPMRVTFTVDCEEKWFPVALASMFSKYMRELHMSIFNRFWTERVVNLKPTAGYTTDARRFLADIEEARSRLSVNDAALIRNR